MQIIAKASMNIEEINEKIRCGCDGIEYNLTSEFYEFGKDFLNYYPSDIFHMKNVEVVHTPSDKYHQMMNLERIFLHEDISSLENVFRMAQYLADFWKHRMKVVIHSSLSMFDFIEYEILRQRVEKFLSEWFEEYPGVDLLIENVIPMEYKAEDGIPVRLCNGAFLDTPQIASYLEERFGKRVGTVLDICHAMMTQKYLTELLKKADYYQREGFHEADRRELPKELDYSMEHTFLSNAGICQLIHFNDLAGNGYGINHGIGFDEQYKVDDLLNLYKKFEYDCPLTIEIREDDYRNCVNYRRTKSMIENWLQRE